MVGLQIDEKIHIETSEEFSTDCQELKKRQDEERRRLTRFLGFGLCFLQVRRRLTEEIETSTQIRLSSQQKRKKSKD